MVQIIDTTRSSITVSGMVNGSLTQINGFFHRQIFAVAIVQHTIGVGGTTANRKILALQTRTVIIHIVQLWTRFIPTRHHGTHGQTVPAVRGHDIGQQFGSGRHRNATSIAKFVQSTFLTQVTFPKGAIGGATGHGAQQKGVDFNHLLDRSRRNIAAHGGTRIDRDDNSAIEFKGQRGCSLGEFYGLFGVAVTANRGKVAAAIEGGIRNIWNIELTGAAQTQRCHGRILFMVARLFATSQIENVIANHKGGWITTATHESHCCKCSVLLYVCM
mmetsp:Transcript_19225/g.52821  ORF Transcript_19225/g.52821 Transcript_19225/m.52821 type:complete len:273 (-) Transcript_19225:77-895(-)